MRKQWSLELSAAIDFRNLKNSSRSRPSRFDITRNRNFLFYLQNQNIHIIEVVIICLNKNAFTRFADNESGG